MSFSSKFVNMFLVEIVINFTSEMAICFGREKKLRLCIDVIGVILIFDQFTDTVQWQQERHNMRTMYN